MNIAINAKEVVINVTSPDGKSIFEYKTDAYSLFLNIEELIANVTYLAHMAANAEKVTSCTSTADKVRARTKDELIADVLRRAGLAV